MSIKEIAKRTGASQATVSRVLNNPDHRCSDPKLRDKIWKAAMELHYVPNEAARDLKNKKQGDKKQTYYIQVLVTRSDIGQQIMESEFPPSAVYCANDIIAVGMLKALARNRRQYQSISIISSDNIELASQISPMLTTVALPKEEI